LSSSVFLFNDIKIKFNGKKYKLRSIQPQQLNTIVELLP